MRLTIFLILISISFISIVYSQDQADKTEETVPLKTATKKEQLPSTDLADFSESLQKQKEQVDQLKRALLMGIGLLTFLILVVGRYYHVKRSKDYQKLWDLLNEEKRHIQRVFEGQEKILSGLKNKIETIERTLLTQQLNYDRQQSILGKIIGFIKKMVNSNQVDQLKMEIQQISRSLESERNRDSQWENFTLQIENIHPHFFTKLMKQSPALKSRDLRLSAFIRLGMDNQEIAQLLGIENASVIKARHRLKKKLTIDKNLDLNHFLLNL